MENKIKVAAEFLRANFGEAPKVAAVLGSGLSAYAEQLSQTKKLLSSTVPGGAPSTVQGHSGSVVVGNSGKTRVALLAGRVHGFEGHSPTQVVHLVRAFRHWGVEKFILTNAAGSTSKHDKPGSLVLLRDIINFTGLSPLTGTELYDGPRFPDMSDLFSKRWRKEILKSAKKAKLSLREGVYAGVNGPSYETAAEIRMLNKWGADVVGMSTVWEAIALKQMGAEVVGISCVTNFGTGVTSQALDHSEVIDTTQKSAKNFTKLLNAIFQETL